MARYTSKAVTIPMPVADLAAKFSDFRDLQTRLDELPEEQRARVGQVSFSQDTITITTPQVGAIELRAVERTPDHVYLQAEKSPVPMRLEINFAPKDADHTEVSGAIDVEIPMMLKPMIGPTLQKAADQFGSLFASLV